MGRSAPHAMDLAGLQALGQQQQLQAASDRRQQGHGIELEGVWVEFPFEPYDCQVRGRGWGCMHACMRVRWLP